MKKTVIGLTGGIATGKSEALKVLRVLGARTFSADKSSHDCLRPGSPVFRAVVRKFGTSILSKGGRINRAALAGIIFSKPAARKKLERLIHPEVFAKITEFVSLHSGVIVLDIPLLFETHYERCVDIVLLITASQQAQVERLHKRNNLTRTEALQRIRAQKPLAWKKRHSDVVLPNNGTKENFKKSLVRWYRTLQARN